MKLCLNCISVLILSLVLTFQFGCQPTEKETLAPQPKIEQPAEKAPQPAPVKAPAVVTPPKPMIKEIKPETPEGKRGPRLKFENVTHNFGNIGPASRNTCEFKFTNTGDMQLNITRVTKTCGCTPFELDKKQYAPGESGVIKVNYNAGKRPGNITKHLYVFSNDSLQKKVGLTIKGNIVLKVTYAPETLKLLLQEENAGCQDITIQSLDGKEFSIRSFKATGNCITADFDPQARATKFVLKPAVNMEKLRKGLNGRVEINISHPGTGTVYIPFNTLARFKVTPAALILTKAEPQKPIKRTIWVLNNYGEDFEIESVSSKSGIINVLSKAKVGTRYKIELEVTPPAKNGEVRLFTDTLNLKIADGETLNVNCSGFYSNS